MRSGTFESLLFFVRYVLLHLAVDAVFTPRSSHDIPNFAGTNHISKSTLADGSILESKNYR